MRLTSGSRIIIVGGGPAGSFTALHLLKEASQAHLDIQVTVFEARDFNQLGVGSCNKCAGILSSGLVHNLLQLGLEIPAPIVQSELKSYILHFDGEELPLHLPDPLRRIYSVYRGRGPRLGDPPAPPSFDHWLLDMVRSRGGEVKKMHVRTIRPGPRPVIVTASAEYEADLVVLATGANSRSPVDPDWGYQPPRTARMAQDEIQRPNGIPDQQVHIFFDDPKGLIFGGLIPKGRYLNISLLGNNLPADSIIQFLRSREMALLWDEKPIQLCGCSPSIVISPAGNYFADRFVAVGDAAATRLYKDGMGSAFITAQAAAKTAVQRGISKQDFAERYQPTCNGIIRDNAYGRLLIQLWAFARKIPLFRKIWKNIILFELNHPDVKPLYTLTLWGMFTGDESYRKMFWRTVSGASFFRILQSYGRILRQK